MTETDLLINLVKIPSFSTEEKKASEFLVGEMKNLGFDQSFVDQAGNAIGIMGTGEKQIVLLGHIDTVPGDIKVRVENNILYGRGSVDAKGPLATFTMATAQLGKEDLKDKQIIVIGAVEEEITTSKGARYVLDKYQPEFCIIGEPSGWEKITLGYKGIINFDYEISSKILHHSQAETPIKQGLLFINEIESYLKPLQTEQAFSTPTLEIRSINSVHDGLELKFLAKLAVRIPPDFDGETFKNFIESKRQLAKIQYTQELEGIVTEKSNDLVFSFLESIREQKGTPGFKKKTGSSDMCIAGPPWKCPIVAYGPGDSKLDHTPNEHVDLDEYKKSISILKNVLKNL